MARGVQEPGPGSESAAPPAFGDGNLLEVLEIIEPERLDDLDFGLIVMDREGMVVGYNDYESRRAGLSRERVLGRHFFADIGSCADNDLVAGRFRDGGDLDAEVEFVFTFRMRVSPVRLRRLARDGGRLRYLAVLPR